MSKSTRELSLKRPAQCALALALIVSLGGHWQVAQLYAWMTMIRKAAPEQGVLAAVESALSGDNPCRLCRCIQANKNAGPENQAPLPDRVIRIDHLALAHSAIVVPRRNWRRLSVCLKQLREPESVVREVLLPPPKAS